jgi:transposase
VFEMAGPIQSPAKCEVRSVVQFLNAKGKNVQQKFTNKLLLFMVILLNLQNVTKWCREFFKRRADVHDEQRSGRPSLISDDLLQEIEGETHAN